MDQALMDAVISQIVHDVEAGDLTAIEELLKGVSQEQMERFLSDA